MAARLKILCFKNWPAMFKPGRAGFDVLAILCLFVVSSAFGTAYLSNFTGSPPAFYPRFYAPAVSLGCGKSFANPDPAFAAYAPKIYSPEFPKLSRFLEYTPMVFDCSELANSTPSPLLSTNQRQWRYLMWLIGTVWRLSGEVSWEVIKPIFGVVCGIIAALTYGIMRLGMGPFASLVFTLIATTSAVQIAHISYYRDISKAPFILAVMLISAYLASRWVSDRRLLVFTAIGGVVIGLGLGFRIDTLITLPFFVVTILFFLVGRPGWAGYKIKLASLALFLLTLSVAGSGVIPTIVSGRTNGAWGTLEGFSTPFDNQLGLNRPFYDLGYRYSDFLYLSIVRDYGDRIHDSGTDVDPLGPDFSRLGGKLLFEIVRTFPADLYTRAMAAVINITEAPFSPRLLSYRPSGLKKSNGWTHYFKWRQKHLHHFRIAGPVLAGLGILTLAAAGWRLGSFALLTILYFCGYPAAQFQPRHYFFLEFISWFWLGFLLYRVSLIFPLVRSSESWRDFTRKVKSGLTNWAYWRRAFLFGLISVGVLSAMGSCLRLYQHHQVGQMVKTILEAPRQPLGIDFVPIDDKHVLAAVDECGIRECGEGDPGLVAMYLGAKFAKVKDGQALIQPIFRYESLNGSRRYDMSRQFKLNFSGEDEQGQVVFFPIYNSKMSQFDSLVLEDWLTVFRGIELKNESAGSLLQLWLVKDLDGLPLRPGLILPGNWDKLERYQTFQ